MEVLLRYVRRRDSATAASGRGGKRGARRVQMSHSGAPAERLHGVSERGTVH